MNTPQKKRLLFIHDKCEIGGGEVSLLNLWETLDKDNYEIFLIIPEKGPLSSKAKVFGVQTHCYTIPKLSSFKFLRISQIFFTLRKFIKENAIDLIHTYTPRNNILGAFLGRSLNIPVVWHERNLIVDNEPDFSRKYSFLPNRIICNSKAVAQRFEDKGQIPRKVQVILNGVNLSRFSPREDSQYIRKIYNIKSKNVVGIVSALTERKRIDYFIDAAAKILKIRKNVFFVIVGDGFYNAKGNIPFYKKKVEEQEMTESVLFTGFHEDIPKILTCFDVSAHVTKKEACSRAIIESLACGIPVVAMDDGGNPELIQNGITGILSPPDDMDHFVHSILNLLDDDGMRLMMGRKSRESAEKTFDVARNTQETQNIYNDLLMN